MAKKQSVKKSLPKKTGNLSVFWNKHWQVILIIVLAFGILGFIGVNKLIIYNQKQQFDQAEKSLDTLYANIVKDVGQPTSMAKDKSCSYASTEGGRGRLGCGIGIVMKYDVESAEKANNLKQIVLALGENTVSVKYSRNLTFLPTHNSSPGDEPAFDFKCPGVITCSLSMEYHDPDDKSSTAYSKRELVVDFAAGGESHAEFYPVKN